MRGAAGEAQQLGPGWSCGQSCAEFIFSGFLSGKLKCAAFPQPSGMVWFGVSEVPRARGARCLCFSMSS